MTKIWFEQIQVFWGRCTIPCKNPTVRQHSQSAYSRALCHTSKDTCCLATTKTQAHYHAATTVVCEDLHVTNPWKKNIISINTHMLEQTIHMCVHTLCINSAQTNKEYSAAGLVFSGLHVLRQTHACFLMPHGETNPWNVKLIIIHAHWLWFYCMVYKSIIKT